MRESMLELLSISHASNCTGRKTHETDKMEHLQPLLESVIKAWESPERKWLVTFRSPLEIWEENPSFLFYEWIMYIWAYLTLRHALKHRGRCLQLWVTAVLHGLVTESLSYILPDIDSFWHFRGSVMLLKQRLPLYIMLFYPCTYYTSNMAVSRLKLQWWAEPFAVGVADVLLDLPYDIMGIKLIWWTWHDTDPNIFDRSYFVPLTSYIFHMSFAWSFSFLFNTSRWFFTGSRDKERPTDNYFSEFVCMIVTGLLSMPLAVVLQFIPLYHILHDVYSIHTEVSVWIMVGLYVVVAWTGDRSVGTEARKTTTGGQKSKSSWDAIACAVLLHYLYFILAVFTVTPERYRSTGPHETVGDCDKVSHVHTAIGLTLSKKSYLCLSDHSQSYFDFHCLNSTHLPTNGSAYYTICGTPFENRMEYIVVVITTCILGLAFYYQALFRSGRGQKVKKA